MKDNAQIKRLLDQVAVEDSKAAYKELFILLYKQLCQFAYGILRSQDDAEEVVSDTFAFIWEKETAFTILTPHWPIYIPPSRTGPSTASSNKNASAPSIPANGSCPSTAFTSIPKNS
ncbi:hypothetical protein [Paraflavitalea speifideaquila]|uniref:hypothetical protein n=1 Tax=Paraflavitalea speifideaquila TaxID=3076558 RepID=UPI0028E1AEE6|nr:hypothetical protein [Paraflavitalea speifideiaquila]